MLSKSEIKKLPKIDLHRHLDGDVLPAVIGQLAEMEGIKLNLQGNDLQKHFERLKSKGIGTLLREGFGLVTSLLQSKQALELAAYEVARNLSDDNIIYAEIRFAPQYHNSGLIRNSSCEDSEKGGLSYEEIVSSVKLGLEKGRRDFGAETKIIFSIGREVDSKTGAELAAKALTLMGEGVVALDLACDETLFLAERHIEAYQKTFGTALRRTVHAGEMGESKASNMLTAINQLKADRVGHAITLSKMEGIAKLAAVKGVGIEMCPDSNLYARFIADRRELGIEKLLGIGLLVSINSDDPGMFGYTLSDSLLGTLHDYGFGYDKLQKFQLNAVESSFCTDAEKQNLHNRIKEGFEKTLRN